MKAERRRTLLLLGGLCALFALAQLQFLDDPYHWDALYYVTASARDIYLHPGQLITQGPWDNGHPPLFFWLLAAAWWVAGPHVAVSHLIVLACATATLALVFALGRRLFNPRAGFLAALFLAVNPIFFYHSGTVTGDIPVAALTLAALIAALRGRWGLAAAAACAMTLIRESAVLFPPVLAAAAWLLQEREERPPWRGMLLMVAAPILALTAWFAVHGAVTGWWIYSDSSREVKLGLGDLARSLPYEVYARAVRPFLRGHGQWAATLSIAAALAAAALARRGRGPERTAWILAGTTAALVLPIGMATALMGIFLPRYLLPALPIFSALAGWAVARTGRWIPVTAAIMIAPLVLAHEGDFTTGWEANRSFLHFIEVTRRSAAWLEEEHPSARVLAPWPLWQAICDPIYGYVTEPHNVLVAGTNAAFQGYCPAESWSFVHRSALDTVEAGDFDLIWVFSPADLHEERFAPLAARMGFRFVARFESGPFQLFFFAPVRDGSRPG